MQARAAWRSGSQKALRPATPSACLGHPERAIVWGERDSLRVAFALLSFVVGNRDGRVATRYGGPFMRSVFTAADSVLSARQAAGQESPDSNE